MDVPEPWGMQHRLEDMQAAAVSTAARWVTAIDGKAAAGRNAAASSGSARTPSSCCR